MSPETIMKSYCNKVGIQFDDSMLRWDEAPKDLQVFQEWMPWFEGVLTSTSFQPSATKPKSPMVMPDLPRHVLKAIEDNMPYYNKLHALRLKPDLLTVHWSSMRGLKRAFVSIVWNESMSLQI